MKILKQNQKGFTLIELLVVVSIISFLSSMVFASLNNARIKARDTAIKSAVKQYETLLNLEFNETGSFATLQKNYWVASSYSCSNYPFGGNYASRAIEICNTIRNNITPSSTSGYNNSRFFHTGTTSGVSDPTNVYKREYSIMALLSDGTYFCAGSGGNSIGTYGVWNTAGCFYNP
jgi:prepilin-type N-terminal cleavage/methylation domain-containing protein